MSKVNLDALIPREDFSFQSDKDQSKSGFQTLTLGHLLPNTEGNYISIYHLLRKPDFQRETNEWDKNRIGDLIESFIETAFIPSIILWENKDSGKIYVIDGAHRLSAIIAYINDDYGDRSISTSFYKFSKIPQAELDLAEETRIYINKRIGAFVDVMKELGPKSDGLKKAAFDLQMIPGNVKKAEDSFFKINQQGVVLSPTERELCKAREYPYCIATRSIIKGNAGTQYWKNFEASNQTKIKDISEQLHRMIFYPPYNENHKSIILDHPIGGLPTNATPMIFDLMNVIKTTYFNDKKEEKDIVSGGRTLEYLVKTRNVIWQMLSEQPGSLGLFPTVYFYNSGGKYIQSAFLGMAQLLIENDNTDFFIKFTKVRSDLEKILMTNKVLITQINRKYGSKAKSFRHMKGFFLNVIDLLGSGIDPKQVLIKLKEKEHYSFLNELEGDIEPSKKKKFSKEAKISFSIEEELATQRRCAICNGLLHPLSISYDHIIDLKYGGDSNAKNRQPTHFYCNNSKDTLIERGIYTPPYDE